jgi:thioredoxin-like negative regulator of GroEL
METVFSLESLETLVAGEKGLVVYFSNEMCSVCRVLKPKVAAMLKDQFPGVTLRYVDIDKSPMLAGQHRVFTIPTLVIFFDGKEQHRFSRNISLQQLEEALEKPYRMLFSE